MIQRIQSVFLLLSLAGYILMLFFPLADFLSEQHYYKFYITRIQNLTPGTENIFSSFATLPLIILLAAPAVVAAIALLKYKNRPLQVKLVKYAVFFTALLIFAVLFGYPNFIGKEVGGEASFDSIGPYLPVISLVFLILAGRAIMKDEKLVRSADRLR